MKQARRNIINLRDNSNMLEMTFCFEILEKKLIFSVLLCIRERLFFCHIPAPLCLRAMLFFHLSCPPALLTLPFHPGDEVPRQVIFPRRRRLFSRCCRGLFFCGRLCLS